MEQISTVRQLVTLWPSRSAFAEDCGVPLERVHGWVRGSSIPARYHAAVLRGAVSRGFALTAEVLVAIHDKEADPEAAA